MKPPLTTGLLEALSLKRRLLVFALLCALPAMAVVALQFAVEIDRIPRQGLRDVEDATTRIKTRVDHLLGAIEGTVNVMGVLGLDNATDPKRCSLALQRAAKSVGKVLNFSLVSPEGLILCSAMPAPTNVRFDDRPYFQEALRERRIAFSGYTIGRVTKREAVQVAVPILSETGTVQVVAIAAIDPVGLASDETKGAAPPMRSLVFDRDGVLLSMSSSGENIERGRSYAHTPLLAALRSGATTTESVGLDGINRLFSLAPVVFEGRTVFYVATSVYLSAIERASLINALTYGALVLLTGVMVSFMAQVAIRPVVLARTRALISVASAAVEGRYHQRVPIGVSDELTPIEEAVNTMLASVESDRAHVAMLSERNALIAEATNDIIYDWNAITGEFWCNQLSERAWRANRSSPILSLDEWFGFIDPQDQARVRAQWQNAIDSGIEYCELRYRVQRPEPPQLTELLNEPGGQRSEPASRMVYMFERAHLIRNDAGTLVRVVSGARDVTAQTLSEMSLRESEQQVRQLNEELETRVRQRTAQFEMANRELESFSYSVSHDLRSPLNTIDGFGKLLGKTVALTGDEQAAHYLRRIRAGVKSMGELIEGLLSLSQVSRDAMKDEAVNLTAMAQQVVQNFRDSEPDRHAVIVVEENLSTRGDARLLKAAMDNLIGNALKFTSKTASPQIHIGQANVPGHGMVFFVRDNGAGFDMAYADKLFGTFERLHTTTEFPGSGIGLASVKRIVQRHGGRIWAESRPGQGATFYFVVGSTEAKAV